MLNFKSLSFNEAQAGQSKTDFISKLSISSKEYIEEIIKQITSIIKSNEANK